MLKTQPPQLLRGGFVPYLSGPKLALRLKSLTIATISYSHTVGIPSRR